MPYSAISQLPPGVKDALPEAAQKIFLSAFDAAFSEHHNEEKAFKIAWGAVKNAGYKKDKEGNWVKSDELDDPFQIAVNRYDTLVMDRKSKRTSQGFLKVSANVSRAGVFLYRNADGSTRRELRHPDEIFKQDSIDSLKSSPITFGHPVDESGHVLVNPKNIKKFTVGVLGENIRTDARFIAADLTIMEEKSIEAVEKGHRREISLGYTCDLDFTPGFWNGEAYDAIQRNVVYNHAAIVQRGRAGHEVSIHMDSADAVTEYIEDQPITEETKMENTKIHVDGVDLEFAQPTAQIVNSAIEKRDSKISALTAELDGLKGQIDAMKEDLTKAEKARMDAQDPTRLQEAVAARVELVSKASKVLGSETDLTAKSDREVKETVIAKVSPEMNFDSLSDDYINGRFDHVVETFKNKQESLTNAAKAADAVSKAPAKPEVDARQVKLNAYASAHKKLLK